MKEFANAANYIGRTNFNDFIRKSVNKLVEVPNSKSVLVKELIKYKNQPYSFFEGFIQGLSNNDSTLSNYSISKSHILGLVKAFEYQEIIRKIDTLISEQQESFNDACVSFNNVADEYVNKYNALFAEKEQSFKDLDESIKQCLNEEKQLFEDFHNEKQQKMKDIEDLYSNKLRMMKPAEYWKQMSKSYTKKGAWFMVSSVVVALLTVFAIAFTIIKMPLLNGDSHWYDVFKNTALITVMTTILIYIMRVLIKMALSSIHLSRDAREREQLTYFYLALINEDAVSDKERELVMTSLFSRSDTGLLKGDASPEMPTISITDFMNKKQ